MAFLMLATVSAAAGLANLLLTEDPRRLPAAPEEQQHLLPSASGGKAAAAARHAAVVAADPAGTLTPEAELELESAPLRHRSSSRAAAASTHSSSSLALHPATPSPASPRHALLHNAVNLHQLHDAAHEPAAPAAAPSAKQQLRGLAGEVAAVLRIPTFRLIVAQVRWAESMLHGCCSSEAGGWHCVLWCLLLS